MVKELQLPIKAIPECAIRLSDGYRTAISSICPKIKLVIQDANFEANLFPFELPGVEIVLGISWLKTVGTIQANFEHLWIHLKKEGRCFELKGEPELTFRQVSIKTLSNEVVMLGNQMKNLVESKQVEEEETVATYMAELKKGVWEGICR